MLKPLDNIRGNWCTERNRHVGRRSEVQAHRKGHHDLTSRLNSAVAAAAGTVRSSKQQQAPNSNSGAEAGRDDAASALHAERDSLRVSSEQQQEVQQLQVIVADVQPQQDLSQQLDGINSIYESSRPYAAVLGSRPGVVWHMRRNSSRRSSTTVSSPTANSYWTTKSNNAGQVDWSAQYAAAAILDAFGSMDATSNGSSTDSVQESVEEVDVGHGQQQQSQQQQQHIVQEELEEAAAQHQGAGEEEQETKSVPQLVDYQLLDRLNSHAAASSSVAQASRSLASNNTSTSSSGSGQPGVPADHGVTTSPAAAAAATAAVEDLLYMHQSPAANFRDPRFEMAISRWIKEAPDWFKLRTIYERLGWRFNIVNLSCMLLKLSTLLEPVSARRLLPKEQTALRKFLSSVLSSVGDLLPSVDAGTAAAVLLSYSKLLLTKQVRKNPQLIASLLEHMRFQLSTLQPRELAGCLWALQTLQHRPPDNWLDELYLQTEGTVSQLRGDEVAVLLKGLAGVQAAAPSTSWLSAVLAHAEQQLETLEPKHMAMMLMGLAYMQVRPSRSWMDAAMSAMRSKLDQMGPQALSNILWALAKMGCLPDRPWLNSYFNATQMLLNSMNSLELSVNMWSVHTLKLEPNDEWLDEYFDETEAKLLGFSLRDLALCGYSLAKLGLRPPQTWLRRYCTLLLRLKGGLWKNKKLLTQVLVALDSFKVPRMDMWRRELYSAAGYKLYKYPDWRQRVKAAPTPAAPYSMWPYSSKRRRFSRRSAAVGRAAGGLGGRVSPQGVGGAGLSSSPSVPAALRSGDWGVMDAMGGGRGVMGSVLSSYEELGTVSIGSTIEPTLGSVGAARGETTSTGGSEWSGREQGSNSSRVKINDIAAVGAKPASEARPPSAGASFSRAKGTAAQRSASMLTGKGWSGTRSGLAPPRRPLSTAGLVRPPPPATALTESGEAKSTAWPAAAGKPATSPAPDGAVVGDHTAVAKTSQQQLQQVETEDSVGSNGSGDSKNDPSETL